jgi:AAA domain-containing protein
MADIKPDADLMRSYPETDADGTNDPPIESLRQEAIADSAKSPKQQLGSEALAPPAAPAAPMSDDKQNILPDDPERQPPLGPVHSASFVEQKVGALTFAGIPIATVSQVKPFVNVLIYGLPGAGKTHVAATGAESKHLSPMLYVNAEAGANTLLKFRARVGDNIMVVPDPQVQSGITWEQFEAVYDELDRQCYNTNDGPDFRTVVIDTGTELQKINMDWVMARTMKQHPDRDPDVPGLHDWGASTNRMRKYMRLFRNLPMNFIFLCHETTERDNKGVMWKRPDLPGKMANQVAGLFDQAMYLYTKEGDKGDESKATIINRYLLTGALEGYVTKDRSGNLPLVVANPNMNDIFELIHS